MRYQTPSSISHKNKKASWWHHYYYLATPSVVSQANSPKTLAQQRRLRSLDNVKAVHTVQVLEGGGGCGCKGSFHWQYGYVRKQI